MTKELVISSNRHETKVAVLEDEQLVEIYFQRSNEYSLVGSIHKGRVTRVLPGMQSAFVNLGLERDAFLYVSDFFEQPDEDYERVPVAEARPPEPRPDAPSPAAEAEERLAEAPTSRDNRDSRDLRRGRRSRRRRRSGRGFPDSKYAPAVEAAIPEALPEEEPEQDQEAFVLPGESIAKYQQRPSGGAEADDDQPPEAEEAPDDFSAGAGEGFETGLSESPAETETGEEASSEPLDQESASPPDSDSLREEIERLVDDSFGEEAAEAAALAAQELAEAQLAAETEEPEAASEAPEEAFGEEEAGPGGEPGEQDTAGSDPEPDSGGAVEAELREQPVARYIQRGPRRIRRRGGRPDRGERADRGDRPERTERVERLDAQTIQRPERERAPLPSISDLLKEGQEIIVQIRKEPLGQKGARITSHIAMPGRYVVYMPTLDHLGVSRKVSTDEERLRLKRILQAHSAGMTGGFIVRTAGEGRSEPEIAADMSYLYNQWLDIRKRAEKHSAPWLLHHDLTLVNRILRDQVNEQYRAIWCDNEAVYETVVGFLERFQPQLVSRVKLYTRDTPIFDTFNVTAELEKALRPKMWLKSGGYIVINQTEALVAIDINTGKFVGKSNRLEDTIVKTNIEAVKEIVRQIRLRDLGGIIVVDFIDMEERKNRQKVMQALEEAMRTDRAPYKILQFNDFGLVAITRRRVKQSLERSLCSPCPTCEGAGYVKSVQTIIGEILTEAHKIAHVVEGKDVLLRVHPDVARELKSAGEDYIEELEEILGRTLIIKSDPELHPEKFDLN